MRLTPLYREPTRHDWQLDVDKLLGRERHHPLLVWSAGMALLAATLYPVFAMMASGR